MIPILLSLGKALILTCVLESIPLLFLRDRKKWLRCGLLCNCITNPLLNILRACLFLCFPSVSALQVFTITLECIVVFVEALIYRSDLKIPFFRSLFISLICNVFSYGIGLLIFK